MDLILQKHNDIVNSFEHIFHSSLMNESRKNSSLIYFELLFPNILMQQFILAWVIKLLMIFDFFLVG